MGNIIHIFEVSFAICWCRNLSSNRVARIGIGVGGIGGSLRGGTYKNLIRDGPGEGLLMLKSVSRLIV